MRILAAASAIWIASESPEWTHSYRLRSSVRNIGIAAVAFGAVMGVGSTLIAWFNIDGSFPNPVLAAALFAIFWSLLVILGIALILLYYRYRLLTNASAMLVIGVVRRQHAVLDQIHQLSWRRFPEGGSARLSGTFGRLKIDFGNFIPAERERLIAFLRQAVDPSKQERWEEFCAQFADTPERQKRVFRAQIRLGLLFLAIALAFFGAWLAGFGAKYLATAVMNALFAAFMLWRSGCNVQLDRTETVKVPVTTTKETSNDNLR